MLHTLTVEARWSKFSLAIKPGTQHVEGGGVVGTYLCLEHDMVTKPQEPELQINLDFFLTFPLLLSDRKLH